MTVEDTSWSWVEVGERIRNRRNAAGMSQAALAQKACFSPPAITRIENGKSSPQIETLAAIAKSLGTSLRALVCGDEAPSTELTILNDMEVVLKSGNEAAIAALLQGLTIAEAILASPVRRKGLQRLALPRDHNAFPKEAIERAGAERELRIHGGTDQDPFNAAKALAGVSPKRRSDSRPSRKRSGSRDTARPHRAPPLS